MDHRSGPKLIPQSPKSRDSLEPEGRRDAAEEVLREIRSTKKYSVCLTMRGAVCQGKMGAQSYKGKELSSANTLGEPRNGAFR